MSRLRAEIIPSEPDAVHTAEGKSEKAFHMLFCRPLSAKSFLKFLQKCLGMKITVNNQFREINSGITIKQLMEQLFPSGEAKGIAVAVNQQVVAKNQWLSFHLRDNDHVVLIKATQGG